MSEFWSRNRYYIEIVALILFAIGFLVFVYQLRSIFNPVLLSLLLAYILNPAVTMLEKCHIPRGFTIFMLYVVITTVVIIIFVLIIPLIGAEVSYLYQKTFIGDQYKDSNNDGMYFYGEPAKKGSDGKIEEYTDVNQNGQYDPPEQITNDLDNNKVYNPAYVNILVSYLQQRIQDWNKGHPDQQIDWNTVQAQIIQHKDELGKTLLALSSQTMLATVKTLLGMFAILSYLILLPLYTFFLLTGMNGIRDTVYSYLPLARRDKIIRILHRIHIALSSFFRGKLIICILKGILTWTALEMMGLRYSLIFAIIQTVASIVPFLVFAVGMFPNLIIVLLDYGPKSPYLLGVFVMYIAIDGIEGFIFTPVIMGKETGLHPLTVILSLLVGGELFGTFGLIMSIPLCNTCKILAEEFLLPTWKKVSKCQPYPPPPNSPPCNTSSNSPNSATKPSDTSDNTQSNKSAT